MSRAKYFTFAALLAVSTLAFPKAVGVGNLATFWCLLFLAKLRDIRYRIWLAPIAAFAFLEWSLKYWFLYVDQRWGATIAGYVILALIALHGGFAIAFGLQSSASKGS
jgi:hypothetical protein